MSRYQSPLRKRRTEGLRSEEGSAGAADQENHFDRITSLSDQSSDQAESHKLKTERGVMYEITTENDV